MIWFGEYEDELVRRMEIMLAKRRRSHEKGMLGL